MKKILIIFILPLILLIGAGLGVLFLRLIPGIGPELILGGEPPTAMPAEPEKPKEDLPPPPFAKAGEQSIYFAIDEFVVNLRAERRKPVFLLLSLSMELPNEAAQILIEPKEPRIRDAVNIYLSSLRPEDLSGFDGIQTVRTEIWKRLRKIIDNDALLRNIQISKLTVK
ncbi:MAG: flagellar basal body-associated FliL family protein [Alphaproteobacteria bacterium]|nr:flagellar basal body-associated FliL family protein [Alphaproteobacteria bacterium]